MNCRMRARSEAGRSLAVRPLMLTAPLLPAPPFPPPETRPDAAGAAVVRKLRGNSSRIFSAIISRNFRPRKVSPPWISLSPTATAYVRSLSFSLNQLFPSSSHSSSNRLSCGAGGGAGAALISATAALALALSASI